MYNMLAIHLHWILFHIYTVVQIWKYIVPKFPVYVQHFLLIMVIYYISRYSYTIDLDHTHIPMSGVTLKHMWCLFQHIDVDSNAYVRRSPLPTVPCRQQLVVIVIASNSTCKGYMISLRKVTLYKLNLLAEYVVYFCFKVTCLYLYLLPISWFVVYDFRRMQYRNIVVFILGECPCR